MTGVETRPAKPPANERCQSSRGNARFTIRPLQETKSDAQHDDLAMPFAVELGRAALFGDGFALTFMRSDGGRSNAGLALLGADAASGQILDLASVHGDAAPPLLASDQGDLIVVVADNDAAGGMLRLAQVTASGDVVFGSELDLGVDDSPAFDVALGKTHGLVVWDEWDKPNNRSYVVGSAFPRSAPDRADPARRFTGATVDADGPRVVRRQGGFWLSWIALGPIAENDTDQFQSLHVGKSWIELMPLDETGVPTSPPLIVSPKSGTVAGYDVASGHSSTALLSWREAYGGPGISGGVVRLATVGADGTVEVELLKDRNVGVGVPTFLFDQDPRSEAPHGWLVLDGASGVTRFSGLSPFGRPLEQLEADKTVGIGSLLLAHRGELLLASPQGRSSLLSLLRCGDGTPISELADGGRPPARRHLTK